jgi:hypothetical protein
VAVRRSATAIAGLSQEGMINGLVVMEDVMSTICRTFRWVTIVALGCSTGILPSCASMGGGGGVMRYAVADPIPIEQGI